MGDSVTVRAPASSANLGPGFDCFAAALDLWLEVEVEEVGAFVVVTELDVPTDRSNLVVQAFERLLSADGYKFTMSSTIPLSGGLGSSAAAIVAGLKAAVELSGGEHDLFELATDLEGHPDNVAAAIYGGFVICAQQVVRLPVPDGLAAVLVVPHEAVRTEAARAALPAEVPLGDAVNSIASAAALAVAIERADLVLIANSLGDCIHQRYRAELFPRSIALLDRADEVGALGATVSGAGPTVLLWTAADRSTAVTDQLRTATDGWAYVIESCFASTGVERL